MFLDPHIFERHAEAFAAWSLEGQVGIVLYTRARAYHDHTIAPCEAARSELGFAIGGDQDGIGRCRREADEGVCIGCEHGTMMQDTGGAIGFEQGESEKSQCLVRRIRHDHKRSEENTPELQTLMRISYDDICLN